MYKRQALCYVLYPLLLLNLYAARDERLWQCLLVPAAAFVLLSLFRGLWNAPRPYEQGIDSLMKKKTEGRSCLLYTSQHGGRRFLNHCVSPFRF